LSNVGKSALIHADFQRAFLEAEVVSFGDYDRVEARPAGRPQAP
jgi:hypothetical protein